MIKLFWSRKPGNFVVSTTGEVIKLYEHTTGPQFTGTVREWYETLIETIIDTSNKATKAGLDVSNRTIRVGKDVHCILECSVLYKSPTCPEDHFCRQCGQDLPDDVIVKMKKGRLANRFEVEIDESLGDTILVGDFGEVKVLDMHGILSS